MLKDRRMLPRLNVVSMLSLTMVLGACNGHTSPKAQVTSTTTHEASMPSTTSASAEVAPAVAPTEVETLAIAIQADAKEQGEIIAAARSAGSMSDAQKSRVIHLELAIYDSFQQIDSLIRDAKDISSDSAEILKSKIKMQYEDDKANLKFLLSLGKDKSVEAFTASMDAAARAYDKTLSVASDSIEVARAYPKAVADVTAERVSQAAALREKAIDATTEKLVDLDMWAQQKKEYVGLVMDAMPEATESVVNDVIDWNAQRMLDAYTAISAEARAVKNGTIVIAGAVKADVDAKVQKVVELHDKLIDSEVNFAVAFSNSVLNYKTAKEAQVKAALAKTRAYLIDQAEYSSNVIDAMPEAMGEVMLERYASAKQKAQVAYAASKKAYVATSGYVKETLSYNKEVAKALPGAIGDTLGSGYDKSLDGAQHLLGFLRSHNPFRRD